MGVSMSGVLSKDSGISTIFRKLFKSPDVKTFLEITGDEVWAPPFHVYISTLCKQRHLVPEHVIKRAAIERTYGHQLFNGRRKPSRDKVIQLAFGFEMDIEETQTLLQIAQKSMLYPKIKRDTVILLCIEKKMNVFEAQSTLQEFDLTLLGDG